MRAHTHSLSHATVSPQASVSCSVFPANWKEIFTARDVLLPNNIELTGKKSGTRKKAEEPTHLFCRRRQAIGHSSGIFESDSPPYPTRVPRPPPNATKKSAAAHTHPVIQGNSDVGMKTTGLYVMWKRSKTGGKPRREKGPPTEECAQRGH